MSDFQPGDKVLLDLPGCPPLTVVRVMPDGVRVCVHWFDTTGGYHAETFYAEQLRPCEPAVVNAPIGGTTPFTAGFPGGWSQKRIEAEESKGR